MNKIAKFLKNPYYTIGNFIYKRWPNLLPDKWFLKVLWKQCMTYELDLKHPKTLNEKLQWLKLHDRKPIYRAKKWISDRIGEQYVIPTLAVYNSVDKIDLDKLPEKFVLKCNHDCGSVVICKDKSTFDLDAAKKKLVDALKKNYYWNSREWPYKNVKRCVFAEKYLEDFAKDDVIEYKMLSFKGKVKCCLACSNLRNSVTFYDTDWHKLPFEKCYKSYPAEVNPMEKPTSLEKMIEISEKLSEHIPFARVDFYEINEMPYIGEITLYPGAGFESFNSIEWDKTLGDLIQLPKDKSF